MYLDISTINKYRSILDKLGDIDDMDISSIVDSIDFLMQCLEEYYGVKVMLFIDEYDTLFIEAQIHGFYDDIGFLSAMLSESLKTSTSLKYAVLTGIQRIAKESIFSGLNNLRVYDVSKKKYAEYFGFIESEVKQSLALYNIPFTEDVKNMYNGYCIGGIDIYNPWSVMNYIDTLELIEHWVNTGSNHLIIESMKQANIDFKREYDTLIETGEVETNVIFSTSFFEANTRPNLWGLLVNAGYLTITKVVDKRKKEYCLRIPNDEVTEEFKSFTATRLAVEEDSLSNLFKFLQKKNMERFFEKYNEILSTSISFHDLQSENSYHILLLGMNLWMKDTYQITSNHERGKGRYDILLRNKDSNAMSIIIELKYTKDSTVDLDKVAINVLQQINKKRYTSGIANILKISLAHRGKEVAMSYEY